MKLFQSLSLLLLIITMFSGCGKKHDELSRKNFVDTSINQSAQFIPGRDSVIPAGRMAAWFRCNRELDSLSAAFTGSLAVETAPDSSSCKPLLASQDRICVKNGLHGGYREYRWIMEQFGSGKNKSVYDSMRKNYVK